MHNPVEELLKAEGTKDDSVLVFPSDIAAALWLEEALDITGKTTLPAEKCIAWDRFKEKAMQKTVAGKSPVSGVLRKLYALDLAARNRKAAEPLLSSLIPKQHAQDGDVFAAWISRLLPQLGLWQSRAQKAAEFRIAHGPAPLANADAEDTDLAFLVSDYGRFLDDHSLFEPAWQRPPLADEGIRYFILFPEAIEDFDEYAAILASAPCITQVPVPPFAPDENTIFDVFSNARDELRSCALRIEHLVSQGVPCERIAISVPEIATIGPYLLRELSLRGIPAEYRAGTKLGEHPAGRLFGLISACVSGNFAFSAVKALLLNRLIPWKHREAEYLVDFGIRNHCVTSWNENGTAVDIWEEAFKAPAKGEQGDPRIRDWYRKFRKALSAMANARSFAAARTAYILFRQDFLDPSRLDPADDAVVARCVEELNALAALEDEYRAVMPPSPWAFFVEKLGETTYVPQRIARGVSVFPYRVAAGTPYPWHFVLDASMEHASVVYRQLPFLGEDKRERLRAWDIDASGSFFSLYRCSPRNTGEGAVFSVSERGFSGYCTPHSYFMHQAGQEKASESGESRKDAESGEGSGADDSSEAGMPRFPLDDPYRAERLWLSRAEGSSFPNRLYPAQKDGFRAWTAFGPDTEPSYLETPYSGSAPLLAEAIEAWQYTNGLPRVTATALGAFALCNAKWFLASVLRIQKETSDAELPNERNLGLLYHSALSETYARIRERDGRFVAANAAEYKAWAAGIAENATADSAEFRGPLAAPLLSALSKRVADGIAGIIDADAQLLDGWIPELLEKKVSFEHEGMSFYGVIDRISRRPSDNELVLIDYKSGRVPAKKDCIPGEDGSLGDFQIPMYLFLAEHDPKSPYAGARIAGAWFGNLKAAKYDMIVNDPETVPVEGRSTSVPRAGFAHAEEACIDAAKAFAEAVRSLDFTRPEALAWSECANCDFRKICRYLYAVRP